MTCYFVRGQTTFDASQLSPIWSSHQYQLCSSPLPCPGCFVTPTARQHRIAALLHRLVPRDWPSTLPRWSAWSETRKVCLLGFFSLLYPSYRNKSQASSHSRILSCFVPAQSFAALAASCSSAIGAIGSGGCRTVSTTTSWTNTLPGSTLCTHLSFFFGHFRCYLHSLPSLFFSLLYLVNELAMAQAFCPACCRMTNFSKSRSSFIYNYISRDPSSHVTFLYAPKEKLPFRRVD